MLQDDSARNRLTGIGIVTAATLCFSVLDSSAKWVLQFLPLIQVLWLRFFLQSALSAMVVAPLHGRRLYRSNAPLLQLLRALMLASMTALNFMALRYLQLAETASIMFFAPVLTTLLGWRFLGEALDKARWFAVILGLIGVLVILQPGASGFHPAMLLSLTNAFMIALFGMLSRKLAAIDPPSTTQFLSGLAAIVVLLPFMVSQWQTPATNTQWAVLILLGAAAALGHYLLALSFRFASATTLAPFQYTQIVYLTIIGYLLFGDIPASHTMIGSAIVISSGLFLLALESRDRQSAPR